jgi:hypothetical protein
LKVWNSTFKNIYVGVEIFGDGLQYEHISEESGKLSIEFHFRLPDEVEHIFKQLSTIDVLQR